MSKKCPRCESKDIHITEYPIPTDSMATCYGCGYVGLVEQFPEQSIFDRITASPEMLAGQFIGNIYNDRKSKVMYYSMLTQCWYNNKEDAFNATLAKLKEVAE